MFLARQLQLFQLYLVLFNSSYLNSHYTLITLFAEYQHMEQFIASRIEYL